MSVTLRRFWIRLTADRRRFGILCAALAIGLLLWGRLIIVSQPPRTAVADPVPESNSSRQPSSNPNAGTGADNTKSGKGVGTRGERSPIAVELYAKPSHDPFVISPIYFPKPTAIAQAVQVSPKLDVEPVEDSVQAQARLQAHRRAIVERMKLEAAFGESWAVIDGRKYRVGDVVPAVGERPGGGAGSMESGSFRLVEIRQRSVVLECEGRQFELQMATPGS
jgi:hypothetical protein